MQSSRWGALKARFGWDVERLAVRDGDAIVAGAQVLYRSLPLNLGRLAYIPMGPVVDWDDEEQVNTLLLALQRTVQQRGAFCLKVEPAVLARPDRAAKLASHGFRPSRQTVQWRSTILVDLELCRGGDPGWLQQWTSSDDTQVGPRGRSCQAGDCR